MCVFVRREPLLSLTEGPHPRKRDLGPSGDRPAPEETCQKATARKRRYEGLYRDNGKENGNDHLGFGG